MDITVWVLPGGKLQIMVDGVPFEQAKAATGIVLAALQAQGLAVAQTSEVESHRDGVEHVHQVQDHLHAH